MSEDPKFDSTPPAPRSPEGEATAFGALGLPDAVVAAVADAGYTEPTPIQAETIPALLAGRDVLGQAQTGTGKTAAFALPILALLDPEAPGPQALVLAPTRELALQVSASFETYAKHMRGVRVAAIYGGQPFPPQFRALQAGPAIVVGTPGRLIDHLERGSLDLSGIRWLVLDEADEMLRMGFLEDVTRIVDATPESRSMVLFSATMPGPIRDIARARMSEPHEVRIAARELAAATVTQRWVRVRFHEKFGVLTRILESEPTDGVLVFVRTKAAADDIAHRLSSEGFSSAPLSGDLSQAMREATVERLRSGTLDVLVATDVAARGLDLDRVTHVINYDPPFDAEAYVHRIGRTGRAGREGTAILFVQHRERHVLSAIERTTRQRLDEMPVPTPAEINHGRMRRFKARISDAGQSPDIELFARLVGEWCEETGGTTAEAAAALAVIAQGGGRMFLDETEPAPRKAARPRRADADSEPQAEAPTPGRAGHARDADAPADRTGTLRRPARGRHDRPVRADGRPPRPARHGMEWFRVAVGASVGVRPSHLVGAIANEAGLSSKHIGIVDIHDGHSWVELPEGMPGQMLAHLRRVRVRGAKLDLERGG